VIQASIHPVDSYINSNAKFNVRFGARSRHRGRGRWINATLPKGARNDCHGLHGGRDYNPDRWLQVNSLDHSATKQLNKKKHNPTHLK